MSKSKVTGKRLSIQLGRKETQIVLVGKNSELLHGVSLPTPEGAVEDGLIRNQEAVRDMLKAALQAPEFKGVRQAVFSLSTSQVIVETATTPDLPKSKLEKLIQANADMYFPVDIQDYRLVWEVIRPKVSAEGAKELEVQLWAVPNGMLRGYYQTANACGLSVAAVDYCGHSIATAVGATFSKPVKPKAPKAPKAPKEKKKIDWNAEITFGKKKKAEPEAPVEETADQHQIPDTDVHILLDHDMLGLTFVQEGQVVYQRIYRCGDDPTYQFGELAMMVEYFQTQEIGRGSRYHGYVSGPCSTDPEMTELLQSMLGMELIPFQSEMDPRWLLCLSAARTSLDFGNPTFNSPVHAHRQINTNLWQYAAIVAGGAALIVVVMMLLNARLDWKSEISNLENQRNLLQVQAAKVSGFKENYLSYESEYAAYDRDWENLFNSLHTYNDNLVFVLKELENVMPENTSVTDIIIDSDSVMISFACDDKEEAAYLIMSLRDMEYVDVNTISNLIGGGKGAATEYGTPIEEVTPPTEGGSDDQTNAVIVSRDTVRSKAASGETVVQAPTLEDLTALQNAYGTTPPSVKQSHKAMAYSSLESFNTKHDIDEEDRKAAISAMLSTDHFAANVFVDLIRKDAGLGTYVIPSDVYARLLVMVNFQIPTTYEDAQPFLEKALTILTEPGTIDCTEKLMFTNSYMAESYVHYLEAVKGLREVPENFEDYCPYLNVPADQIDTTIPGGQWLFNEVNGDTVPEDTYPDCTVCCTHPVQTAASGKDGLHTLTCSGCGKQSQEKCEDGNGDKNCDRCNASLENTCQHLNTITVNVGNSAYHTTTCQDCKTVWQEDCKDGNGDQLCDGCGVTMSDSEDTSCKHPNKTSTRLPETFGEDLKHLAHCPDCDESFEEACADADKNNKCDHCGEKTAVLREDIQNAQSAGYSNVPASKYSGTLSEFLTEKKPTYYQREAALTNLFNTNAFAANELYGPALNYIKETYKYDLGISDDMSVKFDSVQGNIDMFIQLIGAKGVDEAQLAELEKLISENSSDYDLERAYLYYLELAMGEQTWEKGTYPHLTEKQETDTAWNQYVWDYIADILDQSGITAPKTPNYALLMGKYLQGSKKDAVEGVDAETLAALETYFFEGGEGLGEIVLEFDNAISANETVIKMLTTEFYLSKYQPEMTLGKNIRTLIEDFGNETVTGNDKLLLALKKAETEAEVTKDLEQDKTLEEHEKEIEALKQQLASLQGDGKAEGQGGAGGSNAVGDTRVFLDIGLIYTEELWNQELQRKGLDRDAKLPKFEVEVG